MATKISVKALDHIIDEMIDVVKNSKDEIFNISEDARSEFERLSTMLEETKNKVIQYIDIGDELEKKVQFSKRRLVQVSKHFNTYSENEIREVYEKTHELQTKLAVLRQEEKVLREKRDDLERRLLNLSETIERAEGLSSKISVILNYLTDDFQQMNEMIEDAKQKQEFGLKIIEAQEEERRKISREIHDGPAQLLANILLRSEIFEKIYRQGDTEKALAEIRSIRKSVKTSLYEVRRIIYDLRPMALDDLGLIPTIKKYIATTSEFHQTKITFCNIGKEQRLDTKYEVALFRLMQESLQNALKHAEATWIEVKLELEERYINLIVKDNGKGFDPTEKQKSNSFGIMGMRERVELLDGKLTIKSVLDKGTVVSIWLPYNL